MISFNWGFSGGVPLASAPSSPFLSPSPSPPAERRNCTLRRCEINYGPSPLSITEESAFPRERRNNQKAFQSGGREGVGGTSDRRAHNAARGLPRSWPLVSYANTELPPSYHYGVFVVFFFFFFNVIIVSGF